MHVDFGEAFSIVTPCRHSYKRINMHLYTPCKKNITEISEIHILHERSEVFRGYDKHTEIFSRVYAFCLKGK